MKKYIAISIIAAMFNLFNANAQEQDNFDIVLTEAGINDLSEATKQKLNKAPRHEEWQLSTGELRSVKIDGFYVGANGGVISSLNWKVAPTAGVTFGYEGAGLWSSNGHRVRIFSAELNLGATLRQYDAESNNPGQNYLSYYTTFNGKVQLFENKWVNSRINLIGSAGYLFGKDNRKIVEVETEDTVEIYNAYYTGSGLTFGGGLEYSYRPSMSSMRIVLRATAENIPTVHLNHTEREWQIKATLGIQFGIARKVR